MKCHGPIRTVVGDVFTDEELDDMIYRIGARAKAKGYGKPDYEFNKALRNEAKELTANELKARIISKRAEAFAMVAKIKREDFFGNDIENFHTRLRELNVGSSRIQGQAALSVDARGRAFEDSWRGELVSQLQEIDGAMPMLYDGWGRADRNFEKEVARELSRLNGAKIKPSENHIAMEVAQVMKANSDKISAALNASGAYIGKLEGYVTKQNHDAIKVSGGFWKGWTKNSTKSKEYMNKWVEYISPKLHEKTFENVDELVIARLEKAHGDINNLSKTDIDNEINFARREFLENIWKDIVLGRAGTGELNDLDAVSIPQGLANKLSKERVLHFIDADNWLEYHSEYGSGSFLETYMQNIGAAARHKAMLEVWGPNPKAAFEAEKENLAKKARDNGFIATADMVRDGLRDREFQAIDGTLDQTNSMSEQRAATIAQSLRTWISMSKLGGMTLSSVTDIGASATALVRAGAPIFESYSDVLQGVSRLKGDDAKAVADVVGTVSRSIAGHIASNFATQDMGVQTLRKLQSFFYKVNGFDFWQKGVRVGVSTGLAKILGNNAHLEYSALSKGMREQLDRFGIDDKLWNLIKPFAQEFEKEGGKYISPDMARQINSDDAVLWHGQPKQVDRAKVEAARVKLKEIFNEIGEPEQFETLRNMDENARKKLLAIGVNDKVWTSLRSQGLDNTTNKTLAKYLNIPDIHTDAQKAAAIDEAHIRLQAWFSSFIDDAMTEPRAAEKMILNFGTRDGTALGIIIRMAAQFKSFPLSTITRNWLPTMKEGASSLGAVMRGEADISELGRPVMMAANTIASMTILGYLAGAMKDIASGKEPLPTDKWETWSRAFVQGGGAGFVGDILFAEARRGQSIFSAVTGPAIGNFEQVYNIFKQLREGEFDDAGGDAWDLAKGNIPFANVFYVKALLNYTLLYNFQEMASPGYLARMEARMQENEGRGFLYEPPQLDESRANQ